MELNDGLKENAERAAANEEKKQLNEGAGVELSDSELEKVDGGSLIPFTDCKDRKKDTSADDFVDFFEKDIPKAAKKVGKSIKNFFKKLF